MMSLPVWLPGPMFLWGSLSLVPCSFQVGVSVSGPTFLPGHRPPHPLDRDPGQRPLLTQTPLYGKEWAVCILLECILVADYFQPNIKNNCSLKQECIPVGCILPTAVAICWGVFTSVYAGIPTPQGVGLETPPPPLGVGLETPRCGPGDPPGQTPQPPPWVWAWKPARHAGIPPPPL